MKPLQTLKKACSDLLEACADYFRIIEQGMFSRTGLSRYVNSEVKQFNFDIPELLALHCEASEAFARILEAQTRYVNSLREVESVLKPSLAYKKPLSIFDDTVLLVAYGGAHVLKTCAEVPPVQVWIHPAFLLREIGVGKISSGNLSVIPAWTTRVPGYAVEAVIQHGRIRKADMLGYRELSAFYGYLATFYAAGWILQTTEEIRVEVEREIFEAIPKAKEAVERSSSGGEASESSSGLAERLGAKTWRDLRLQICAEGLEFSSDKKRELVSWIDAGFGRAKILSKLLIELAQGGGIASGTTSARGSRPVLTGGDLAKLRADRLSSVDKETEHTDSRLRRRVADINIKLKKLTGFEDKAIKCDGGGAIVSSLKSFELSEQLRERFESCAF